MVAPTLTSPVLQVSTEPPPSLPAPPLMVVTTPPLRIRAPVHRDSIVMASRHSVVASPGGSDGALPQSMVMAALRTPVRTPGAGSTDCSGGSQAPLVAAAAGSPPSVQYLPPSAMLLDREPTLVYASAFKMFFHQDFRPSRYYVVPLRMYLLLLLLVVNNAFAGSETVALAVAQLVVVSSLLVALLAVYVIWRPFKQREHVARLVDVYSVVLAVLQALLNCVNTVVRLNLLDSTTGNSGGGDDEYSALDMPKTPLVVLLLFLSYAVLVGAIGLFGVVAYGFVRVLVDAGHRARRRRSSFTLELPSTGSTRAATTQQHKPTRATRPKRSSIVAPSPLST